MVLSDGSGDLHLHTTASDGTCSVNDRITQAQTRDLNVIAITDHDTIADGLKKRVSYHDELELITGVEVRADVLSTKVELLGYYIDPNDHQLTKVLKKVRSNRRDRNRKIVNQLQTVSEFDRSYEMLRSDTNGILGRPHLANQLINDGIVDSISDAFEIYLGNNGKAFVPMERVPAETVIDAIHHADGLVSLAHPGRIRTDDIEPILNRLLDFGLDAIEVPYPYDKAPSEGYVDIRSEDALKLAEQFDLLQTGGSDCHGPESGKFRIGDVRVEQSQIQSIRERANTYRAI